MTSKRKSATPLLTPEMTVTQINRLPVAALKLQLDYYHLAHGRNKQAIARRLHQHLQTLQADSENSSSSNYEDSGTEEEAGTASSHEDSANNATAEEDTGCDTAEEVATGSMPTPFTSAQQVALKRTVRSLMRIRMLTQVQTALSHHLLMPSIIAEPLAGTRPLALIAMSTNGVAAPPATLPGAVTHLPPIPNLDADAHPAPPRPVLHPVAAPALPATVPLTRTAHHTAGRSATPAVIAVSPIAITEQRTWICQRYHVSSGVSSDVVSLWY